MRRVRVLAVAISLGGGCQAYDHARYEGLVGDVSSVDAVDAIATDRTDVPTSLDGTAPDAVPPSDSDLTPDVAPDVGTDVVMDVANACSTRSTDDRADDVAGYQVHLVYAVPSDGIDRALDTNGTVRMSVASWTNWMVAQAGGARLRIDTCGGEPDVTFFRMSATDESIRSRGAFVREAIEEELTAAGRIASNKLYAVYYDGSSSFSCGGGTYPPALVGRVAAIYLQGAPPGALPCNTNPLAPTESSPGYFEFVMLQTLVHSLGVAGSCAPHYVTGGGTSDSDNDLLYLGTAPWRLPPVLDVNHDDYFGHGIPGCIDLARSVFLEPSAPGAVAPPGW